MEADPTPPSETRVRPPRRRGILRVLIALAALAAAGAWFAQRHAVAKPAAGATAPAKQLYTCGMHPQVIQDHPGNCPICGMKLTPVRMPAEAAGGGGPPTAADVPSAIRIDPVTIQTMGIRTAVVKRGPLRRTVRTVGIVAYNETTLTDVTTKFKGWIEKLYVTATGELVMRGDPLFEIYAPELYSAQAEYLLAIAASNQAGAWSDSLRASALTKLRFLDVSDAQIAELDRTRQVRKTLRIAAPRDGFVIGKPPVQGQMVDAGMTLYRLADLGLVWVQAQIYEQDLACIKLGQEATVTLDYLPDRQFRGRVTYIYPTVDERTRTATVRLEFHNPGYYLKPGMFATVHLTAELAPSVLLVPDMAILRSGDNTTVFVALGGGKFDPRTVRLGPQAEDDMYQVREGLSEGERIVTSGQFLLDSESQLREAIQKMREPVATPSPVAAPATARPVGSSAVPAPVTARPESAGADTLRYVCPMPEHVSIVYDHSGTCPICGMTLVPVTAAELRHLQPGGKILYYTCPMPEHSDVHADKPGQCPKCGMTLIPVMATPAPPAGAAAAPARQP